MNDINISGAREHNLKDIALSIPRGKLIVVTGVSGSGKSTLAFDTLYAEGQRRYLECLSAYARQFLDMMSKPDVDNIEGLSPAIAIEQKTISHSPRSTVGTTTEIYDYLRLLYGNIGQPFCPDCGIAIVAQTPQEIIGQISDVPEGTRITIMAPLVRGKKGEYLQLFQQAKKEGFMRIRVDGQFYRLENAPSLTKNIRHDVDLAIDRLTVKEGIRQRLLDSVELALDKGNGLVSVLFSDKGKGGDRETLYSSRYSCKECGFSLPELSARLFSFNAPYGACPECHGLGKVNEIDESSVVPNPELSIDQGALKPWNRGEVSPRSRPSSVYHFYQEMLIALSRHYKFSLSVPWNKLPEKIKKLILYGSGKTEISFVYSGKNSFYEVKKPFEGVIANVLRRLKETKSEYMRRKLEHYFHESTCPRCKGKRLKDEVLAVRFKDKNIHELVNLQVSSLIDFFEKIKLSSFEEKIGRLIISEIKKRLWFINEVGLDYITMDREVRTLSGGEAQRVRLATQIGTQLVGVIYILDEPSIGLHCRDTSRLISTLKQLRDLGNTVIVVEHDEDIIRAADHIIDLGPGAGIHGGYICYSGDYTRLLKDRKSLTASYLRHEKKISYPPRRRSSDQYLEITGAQEHNLKNVNARFPLKSLICVTGVSGSGKSTLLIDILYRYLHVHFYQSYLPVGKVKKVSGIDKIHTVILVDQSPIGRTPRSNPATYTKLFDYIRDIFAQLPEAKVRGYSKGRFSFNMKGGRCEKCRGDGFIKYEMQFLPDVFVQCEECEGKRYNQDTLDIRYRGYSIADILDLTVEEAYDLFKNRPPIARKLDIMIKVGLGYIKIGQSATTFSGGEAQRIKLARELSKTSRGNILYILDEPTTGLHFDDINKLIYVLQTLVNKGNTVIVIEHNLDIIKNADYIIDLGKEGGNRGGEIIATGTPEDVSENKESWTGYYLQRVLDEKPQSTTAK